MDNEANKINEDGTAWNGSVFWTAVPPCFAGIAVVAILVAYGLIHFFK